MNINKFSQTPIYEQIIEEIENEILNNLLLENDKLPSVRSLSVELSINPNTIQKAYGELERSGICYSVPGNGRFVSKGAKEKLSLKKSDKLLQIGEITGELAKIGIPLEEILNIVNSEYEKARKEVKYD